LRAFSSACACTFAAASAASCSGVFAASVISVLLQVEWWLNALCLEHKP
jgi:hypothetical protein